MQICRYITTIFCKCKFLSYFFCLRKYANFFFGSRIETSCDIFYQLSQIESILKNGNICFDRFYADTAAVRKIFMLRRWTKRLVQGQILYEKQFIYFSDHASTGLPASFNPLFYLRYSGMSGLSGNKSFFFEYLI